MAAGVGGKSFAGMARIVAHNVNAWCVPFVTDSAAILLDAGSGHGAYPLNAFGARFAVQNGSTGRFTYKTQCFGLKYDGNRMQHAPRRIPVPNQPLRQGVGGIGWD